MGRGIETFAGLARAIPEAKKPVRKVPLTEKLFWTGLVVIIYLVMAEVPIYGVGPLPGDPFALMRVIFASKRGTLMELGIGPIVTAGLVLQLLVGSKIIALDMTKSKDRSTFTAANKVFAIVMTLFEGSAFVLSGMYGSLSTAIAILVLAQLLAAGIVVIMLDELIQKGWGLGSGISLFIASGVAQTIFWNSFSPIPQQDGYFLGAILALAQSIIVGNIGSAFTRPAGLPSMIGFITMLIIMLIIVYCEGIRVNIPITHARFKGFSGSYPVKYFYVSNIPVILASALFADVYFGANILSSRFPGNFITNLIGKIDQSTGNPTGGLVYYLTSPRDIAHLLSDPIRALIYTLVFVGICVAFSITWVEVGGLGSGKVAQQLISSGLQIPGFRRSEGPIKDILDRYIPAVTVMGAITIGLLAAVGDFFNAFGSGTGILLTTSILWQYYQLLAKERIEEMYPGLSRFLGKV